LATRSNSACDTGTIFDNCWTSFSVVNIGGVLVLVRKCLLNLMKLTHRNRSMRNYIYRITTVALALAKSLHFCTLLVEANMINFKTDSTCAHIMPIRVGIIPRELHAH
jgi:hypothetical protein